MKTTKTATLKQEGDLLLIDSPYNADFVVDLKEQVPWQERKWEKPFWKVQAKHLDVVRALLTEYAKEEGWELLDYTAQSEEEIAHQKQDTAQGDLDRHVAAVLAVLPKLPPRSLRLVDWRAEYLTFEIATFIGDADLFKQLTGASLEAYRPTIIFPGAHKREFSYTFSVSSDERIVDALIVLAGITPLSDKQGSRSGIEYFVIRELIPLCRFEDGIAHLQGDDGSFWIGIARSGGFVDLSHVRQAWQMAVIDSVVYFVFKREKEVRDLIDVRESQYVNPGFGNVAVAQSHPSQVAEFVKFAHIEEWFAEWGNALVKSDKLTPSLFSKPHWHDFSWDHEADAILSHISWTRAGGPEMAKLLGWSKEDVAAHRERIKALKVQAAQGVIDDMKSRSSELALPLLQDMTIAVLLELGAKHGAEVRKSWGKERIVQTLDAQPPVCENVIGLTKRLGGK